MERFCDNNKKFSIPITKMTPDIINILIMLGLERKYYKVHLIQDEQLIKKNYFKSIDSLFLHILNTEMLLIGVYYENI